MRGEQRDDQTDEKTDVLLNHHTTGRFNKPSRPLFFLKRLSPDCRYPLCIIPNLTSKRIPHFLLHYQEITSRISDYFANQRMLEGLEKKHSNKESSKPSQREVKITTKLQY